jgi:hypothetical protein
MLVQNAFAFGRKKSDHPDRATAKGRVQPFLMLFLGHAMAAKRPWHDQEICCLEAAGYSLGAVPQTPRWEAIPTQVSSPVTTGEGSCRSGAGEGRPPNRKAERDRAETPSYRFSDERSVADCGANQVELSDPASWNAANSSYAAYSGVTPLRYLCRI